MAKKKNNDYGILLTNQGFYFGRQLKNGTMSADSRPIGDDELVNAFAAWFEQYCTQGKTDQMWIGKKNDGAILVKRYTADDIRDAATKANIKVDNEKQA